ncbi:hypothetical protein M0R45_007217 [Rubus argutus]|uniref:Vps52 C-terminal domain-containing protein n=1 Tax=Rubus argutus TaxID=59490 RepID=A0AAW1XY51_RUBAR
MIRIIHQHQLIMSRRRIPCLDSYLDKVNIALWPRFKMVFDLHLNSLRNANLHLSTSMLNMEMGSLN